MRPANADAARSGRLSDWERFWFEPADPAPLGLLRWLTGLLVVYAQIVWWMDLEAFFGRASWLDATATSAAFPMRFAWSFWWLSWPTWGMHLLQAASVAACVMFTLGIATRATSVAAWLIVVNTAHRVPAALFGFDQALSFLTLYLAVGPSGACYSWDSWRARRRAARRSDGGASFSSPAPAPASWTANLSLRLIQTHLCVLYLFAGLSKLQGVTWWDGTALWWAAVNGEYQSVDLTWLVRFPWLVNLATHATVAWEISYCAAVWHRRCRPWVLGMAVVVHAGIGLCFGMLTFAAAMLTANAAFLPADVVRNILSGSWLRQTIAGRPTESAAPPSFPHGRPKIFAVGKLQRSRTKSWANPRPAADENSAP